jgi:TRAP-type C4-dicarboxylate transport system permease small subunit
MSFTNRYIYEIIIDVIVLLFFILSMIYSSKIKSDTSSGNPFELEEETDKMNYFKYNISNNYPDIAYCICGKGTFLDFCNEELLKKGCKNAYLNQEFTNFESFSLCEEVQDKIINQNLTLKDIFELDTGVIHGSIITLIILNVVIFIIIIIYFPAVDLFIRKSEEMINNYRKKKEEEEEEEEEEEKNLATQLFDCCSFCCLVYAFFLSILAILFIISLVIIIILIIIIIVFSVACGKYNANDTSTFLHFLECPNVKKEGFYKYYSIGDLSSHFTSFKIVQSFYIIAVFLSGLYTVLEKFIKNN